MADGVVVSMSRVGDVAVLAVVGEIDLASAPNLRTALARVLESRPRALVLDLTAVQFMASVGLQIITETRAEVGAGFVVVADGSATARPIVLTRVDEIVDLYATVPAAVAAVGG